MEYVRMENRQHLEVLDLMTVFVLIMVSIRN